MSGTPRLVMIFRILVVCWKSRRPSPLLPRPHTLRRRHRHRRNNQRPFRRDHSLPKHTLKHSPTRNHHRKYINSSKLLTHHLRHSPSLPPFGTHLSLPHRFHPPWHPGTSPRSGRPRFRHLRFPHKQCRQRHPSNHPTLLLKVSRVWIRRPMASQARPLGVSDPHGEHRQSTCGLGGECVTDITSNGQNLSISCSAVDRGGFVRNDFEMRSRLRFYGTTLLASASRCQWPLLVFYFLFDCSVSCLGLGSFSY